ncbi:MAG: 50S ribosomal protein L18 [Candidatus Aenigmarchaeota archaeon]|nr:50S ribosomal protein L18 [Candidatus Aenigmarchaeota archaeon]
MQFKRRLQKKTDYAQRLALLKSGKPRLVVRRSGNSFHLQIVELHPKGDKTVAEIASNALKKYGWKGHCGNTSAAYLSGLLIGKDAKKKGIDEVVPDLGMQMSIRGSSLFACLVGAKDAGLKINIGKDAVPRQERIEGRHVAEYAEMMQSKDAKKYSVHFSQYLKRGLEPEKLPEHFNEVKKKITGDMREKILQEA